MMSRSEQRHRFGRYQRQFDRARSHREFLAFRSGVDSVLQRAMNPSRPRVDVVAADPVAAPADPRQEALDQAVRDLLVRVSGRSPSLDPPLPRTEPWWSPESIYGFRAWQLIGDKLTGARLPWTEPHQSARCLRRSDARGPVPHDAGECGSPPCGIYAFKNPERVSRLVAGWFDESTVLTFAVGMCSLTKRVIEHDLGYRAEHARAVSVVVLSGTQSVVKTSWVDTPGDLASLFAHPRQFLTKSEHTAGPTGAALESMVQRMGVYAQL